MKSVLSDAGLAELCKSVQREKPCGRILTIISHRQTCSQHMRNLYCLKTIKEPSYLIPQGLLIRLITDPAVLTFWSKRRARLSWTSYQTDPKMSVIFRSHVLQNFCVVWEMKTSIFIFVLMGHYLYWPHKEELSEWVESHNPTVILIAKIVNLGHGLLPRVFFWESGFQTRS